MIRSLSPHYIETPFVSPNSGLVCDSYILEVFVWKGAKLSPPSTPTYSWTIPNPTASTGTSKVNISRVVSDFVEFEPQTATDTNVVDNINSAWVKTQVKYNRGSGTEFAQLQHTELMSRGYYYAMDNQSLNETGMLVSGTDFKVERGGLFCVPILVSETEDSQITVTSHPGSDINFTFNVSATTNSNELVKNLWVKISDLASNSYIEITHKFDTQDITGITLLVTDEWKYNPVQVMFQNKYGYEQVLTFFKERSSNLTTTSESFESDRGQPIDGNHQFVTYNVQGREGFKINSGFVSESRNETFKQLFLSERQWIIEGALITPINIKSKDLTYKTQLKEKLINYEVDFEYSYNEINNI
jgi:hypothetical protein